MKPVYSDKKLKSLATAKQEKMTPISDRARLRLLSQRSLLLGIGCIASLGMLSKGMVWAQTEAPQVEIAAPEASEPPPSLPEPAAVEPETYAPEPSAAAPEYAPEPEYIPEAPAAAAPEPYLPEPEIAPPTVEAPSTPEYNAEAPASPNNAYIDPTDYSVGATNTYEAPTAVQFSERSTGCDAVVGTGQEIAGALCAPPAPQQQTADANAGNPYAENVAAPTGRKAWENGQQQAGTSYAQGGSSGAGYAPRSEYASESGYSSNGGATVASIGSIQVGPITVSSMSDSGFAYYNQTPRPPALPGNGNLRMMFPLSIPAEITSIFGWRTHPVLGSGRFHTGTDLGAPMGTPVLAAYAGQVAIADWLGGYGLAVVLDHNKQSQETLYAHLSELFVKPGEWVQQGEVIGRVGSTGMSTGPHLHFELRAMTNQGWVAIDPGQQLEFALAQMVKTLETAEKVPVMPKILTSRLAGGTGDLEISTPKLPPLPLGLDIEIVNLQPPVELLEKPISKSVSKPKN